MALIMGYGHSYEQRQREVSGQANYSRGSSQSANSSVRFDHVSNPMSSNAETDVSAHGSSWKTKEGSDGGLYAKAINDIECDGEDRDSLARINCLKNLI